MFTLKKFYKSDEWTSLLEVIKDERKSKDQEEVIYCEHCGLPIVKAYDCIGHHKIELTEDNVNDHLISLNPDNIILVHHNCHNAIHRRFGNEGKKEVYIVYGPPCSGKHSYIKSIASPNDLIIDMDNIYQMISCNNRYMNVGRLKSVVFEVRDKLLEIVKYRSGKWQNAYIIGGYPLRMDRERLEQRLNADSFIFVDSTKEECLQRLNNRFTNEESIKEWTDYINEWFDRYC